MKIKNLKDVEATIKVIAQLDAEISTINNDAVKAINEVKANAETASAELTEQREKLLENLKCYSDEHRSELYDEGKKSRDFINGTIGYRQNPEKFDDHPATGVLLIAAVFVLCEMNYNTPVKAALKNFDATQQKKFHISLTPGKETFYCSAAEKAIPENAA